MGGQGSELTLLNSFIASFWLRKRTKKVSVVPHIFGNQGNQPSVRSLCIEEKIRECSGATFTDGSGK
jgi:hypothetical protein